MCKSAEEGGKRCPNIAQKRFQRAFKQVTDILDDDKSNTKVLKLSFGQASPDIGDIKAATGECASAAGDESCYESVVQYARHKSGRAEIQREIRTLGLMYSDTDPVSVRMKYEEVRAWLNRCLQRAEDIEASEAEQRRIKNKAKNAERDASRKDAAIDEDRAARMAKRVKEDDSLGSTFPYLKDMWDPEKNGGLEITQVPKASSRIMLTLTCPDVPDHHWQVRGDAAANTARAGRVLRCPWCSRTRYAQMKTNIDKMLAELQMTPEAWDRLSPSLRLAILQEHGLLTASENSVANATLMANVYGNVSMPDIMNANVVEDLGDGVKDSLSDTEAIIQESTDIDLDESSIGDDDTVDTLDRIDAIMESSLAAGGVSEMLAGRLLDEHSDELWNEVLSDPDRVDEIKERLRNADYPEGSAQADLRDRFLADLERVENMELPEGYQRVRIVPDEDGVMREVTIDPMLMQKRFALMAEDRERVCNWSGTGAGKTLSTVLAARQVGAQDTIVVSPLSVRKHWRREFEGAYPDTDVRFGLPKPGEDVGDPTRPRVWLVNYEQLSTDDAGARLDALKDRVDMVVLDEVHKMKITGKDEKAASKRRRAFESFMQEASDSKKERSAGRDLSVIGLSATPVVNDLNEAKSLLKLVTGESQPYLRTEPTVSNIAKMHQSVRSLGIRWKPQHSQSLHRSDRMVDITADSEDIIRSIAEMRTDGSKKVTASMVERALLPYKMPAIVDSVRSANGKPVIVYSHYVDGMVDPIVERLSQETKPDGSKMRVSRFTGAETEEQRNHIISEFRSGKIDVIVGSEPIATGVDGLQDACSHAVIASMPWTAALDEQLAGRLYRKGMKGDVTIDYIMTETKGRKNGWQWCRSRKSKLHSKKTIADGVVDGIIPDHLATTLSGANGRANGALSALSGNLVID